MRSERFRNQHHAKQLVHIGVLVLHPIKAKFLNALTGNLDLYTGNGSTAMTVKRSRVNS